LEDDSDCLGEIVAGEDSSSLPCFGFREARFHLAAIACADEDGTAKACGDGGIDVDGFVADQPGAAEVQVHFEGGIEQHAGVGLAEGMIAGERTKAVGVTGAGPDAVKRSLAQSKFGFDVVLDEVKVVPGVEASCDAGLIGNDYGGDLPCIETADGGHNSWKDDRVGNAMDVTGFFDDHPITVEKDSRSGLRQGIRVAAEDGRRVV